MKYFSLTFFWTMSLGLSFLSGAAQLTEAEPIDDFSISLRHSSLGGVYHLISEKQMIEILRDHLDFFPKSQVPRLSKHILSLCKKYRLDPTFVVSLIAVESGFRVKAVSPVGALGLMQVMLPTAHFVVRQLGILSSGYEIPPKQLHSITAKMLQDPFLNTSIGIAYLAWLRDYYEDFAPSPYYFLAAYNVGPARMDELLSRKSFRPTETKKYYLSVLRNMQSFRFYRKAPSRSS